jgi:hypothetical protein
MKWRRCGCFVDVEASDFNTSIQTTVVRNNFTPLQFKLIRF